MSVATNAARLIGREELASALQESRAQLLGHLACFKQALQTETLRIPYCIECNLPLWEAGHVAWFQEFWIARNPQKHLGHLADPTCERTSSQLPTSDALYNSSVVSHAKRWQLELPTLENTLTYLGDTLAQTLNLLAQTPENDNDLYFYRLCLFHEDMHTEAARYMANALGIALQPESEQMWDALGKHAHINQTTLQIPASRIGLGTPIETAKGFYFDNELGSNQHALPAFEIDALPVNHHEFLKFVETGGYETPAYWSAAGWQFLQQKKLLQPRFLRKHNKHWERRWFGQWRPVSEHQPITHISRHEAQAYCRWAGRRLPSEAEWAAAQAHSQAFHWGQVWEWTSDAFTAFPGFSAHPYRDYSEPWFDGRPVLKGASVATHARMHSPAYRNYYPAERNDIFSGFRTCAI